jgi:hypothetical protein
MVVTTDLDPGQVIIFKAYKTMTIFCGVDNSRIKNVLLWSENSGFRWITGKWFGSRYATLVYEDENIRRDEDKKDFKGSAYLELGSRLTFSEVKSDTAKALYRRAVKDARMKFESGEIKILVSSLPMWVFGFILVIIVVILLATFI